MAFLISLVLGPFLVLLPRSWRGNFQVAINWQFSNFVCGVAQGVSCVWALVYWYSYSVTHWAQTALSIALHRRPGAQFLEPGILGLMGLGLVVLHPVTWIIIWWGVEGVFRISSGLVTDDVFSTLPLIVIDHCLQFRSRGLNRISAGVKRVVDTSSKREKLQMSIFAGLRQRWLEMRLPLVVDELFESENGLLLTICSCRKKFGWDPGCLVFCQGKYYRIQSLTENLGRWPRPFIFSLHRIPTGVLGRSVIIYSPEGPS